MLQINLVEIFPFTMSEVKKRVENHNTECFLKGDDEEWISEEGGWGYVVCVGFAIIFTITIAPMSSVCFLYNDFLEEIGEGTSAITTQIGVGNAVISFVGILCTCALKRFTLRQVGLLGAFVFSLGSCVAIFVTNISLFIFANGFLQAIGFGIMIPITLTSFNNYFTEKRAAMMSIASIFIGFAAMAFPMAIEIVMAEYGFRGTLMLLFALNLNVIPAMAIMHPVEWHQMPKRRKFKEGTAVNTETTKENIKRQISQTIEQEMQVIDENCNPKIILSTVRESLLGSTPDLKSAMECKGSFLSLKIERELSIGQAILRNSVLYVPGSNSDKHLVKASSLRSLGNWTGHVLATEAVHSKSGKMKVLIDFLDLNLLKDPVYSNICFGISMAFFSDATFFTLEPMMLSSYGLTKTEVAYVITAGAAADLVSRGVFAVASFYVKFKSRNVFFIGNLCIIIFRIAFSQFTDFFHLLVFTACLGFFRNWLHVNVPLTFADYGRPSMFPAAYGLFMFVSGLLALVLSPIIGYIGEISDGYELTLHALTGISLLCTIPWAIEMIYDHMQKKAHNKRTNTYNQ